MKDRTLSFANAAADVRRAEIPGVLVITGASSGIGAALAKHYARPGRILGLIARDRGRLESIANECKSVGAHVMIGCIDIRDAAAIEQWLLDFDDRNPVDLVIVNAGILLGSLEDSHESLDVTRAQIDTNLIGALNTSTPLIGRMERRGSGQIAFTGSLGALAPHPDWPGYCATKAAISTYATMLRERMRGSGVKINVIAPGWVTAPINDPYSMWRPFEISAEEAAMRIARGLERDRALIAFPWPLVVSALISRLFPAPLRRMGYRVFRASHLKAPTNAPRG